jgi:signal transduction histidine kinase
MSKLFSSLRFRLILLVLLAMLPALLLTIFNGLEERKQVETEALENALQLTQFAAERNELLIEDTRVALISLSHAMNFKGDNLSGCGHLFNHLKEVHFPFYSAFYVADLEGKILCNMPNGDIPTDLLGCDHYLELVNSDDFVVSEYHICRNSGKGVISMGYPIWDSVENKIGVINVGIDLMWFNDFAAEVDLPPGSTLTVFDREGVILAQYPEPDWWVGRTLPDGSIKDLVLNEKQGTAKGFDIDNTERLYAFMPLAGSEESVFVTLGIPIDYAFAEVEQSMWRSLLLIGFVALLAILAAWFFGEMFMVRQINQLVDTTQRLANGDLSVRTNAEYSQGEFGILNQSIDEMAEALARREEEREEAEASIREYAANLERSNRDLMDFANITSHDLQEPLRKISTFTDMLLTRHTENLDDQAKDYLLRIRNSAGRLQSLIIDLLTFSRISTKTQPTEQVDLGAVVNQVLSDLELQIEQTNATVNVYDPLQIYADPVQMHQLFLNLVSNSLKFHKQDTPPIVEISGELKMDQDFSENGGSADTKFYEIKIADNGIGFNEKYLERIFHPFQRLHQREEYEGTGMGLAICRKIVERHGGNITAQSKPGQGATFIVRIPIQKNEGIYNE